MELMPCDNCGSKFGEKALARHVTICGKQVKRKAFNSAEMRASAIADLNGTDAEPKAFGKQAQRAAKKQRTSEKKSRQSASRTEGEG